MLPKISDFLWRCRFRRENGRRTHRSRFSIFCHPIIGETTHFSRQNQPTNFVHLKEQNADIIKENRRHSRGKKIGSFPFVSTRLSAISAKYRKNRRTNFQILFSCVNLKPDFELKFDYFFFM